ncbi:hypothetical protein QMO56_11330 [Roseomonas sp. E05]|uniref:hypothetical protein n=1 Tax=Roseomonas sp. E05 TaxID=3046310 RepID=UPI0024BAA476|nr:hypothetical protein [Roseomonas sp. E05]MDJ0388704.1 hypothetical protein [Roseomonas sp. E05]
MPRKAFPVSGICTVSDLSAEFRDACGVAIAFGIVSARNIPKLDAIPPRNAVRFVMAGGEAGAGRDSLAAPELAGRRGHVTALHVEIGRALLCRLGSDGRLVV